MDLGRDWGLWYNELTGPLIFSCKYRRFLSPVRKISRLSVEVSGVDDDVGVGRSVPLDPLHGLDRLKSWKKAFE